jgi:seryl-tRNA synthetase
MEAWLPGQAKYRETHTADYMTDYQTRRLGVRVRREGDKVELAHTNDATAMAMGRTLVAILENYQQEDGSVSVPKALVKYYGRETV